MNTKTKVKPPLYDCTQCHEFIRVNGRAACTFTHRSEQTYRFLKDLKFCRHFWRINHIRDKVQEAITQILKGA